MKYAIQRMLMPIYPSHLRIFHIAIPCAFLNCGSGMAKSYALPNMRES
jgi:hypothetical protein